jgi:hypothetical protein
MRVTCPHCHKGFAAPEGTVAPVTCQACGKTIASFRWWVRRNGRVEQVCNAVALLKIAILAGEVGEDDELSNSGQKWLKAGAIPELASMFHAQRERPVEIGPAPQPQPAAQPAPAREARPPAVLEAVPDQPLAGPGEGAAELEPLEATPEQEPLEAAVEPGPSEVARTPAPARSAPQGLQALRPEGGSELLEARPGARAWRGVLVVLLAAGLGAAAAAWWLGRGTGSVEARPEVVAAAPLADARDVAAKVGVQDASGVPPQPSAPSGGEVVPAPAAATETVPLDEARGGPETVAVAVRVADSQPPHPAAPTGVEVVPAPAPAPAPPVKPLPAAAPAVAQPAPATPAAPVNGGSVPALLEAGDRQLAANPAGALSLYIRAHGLQPDSPEVLTRLGDAYLRVGNLEQSCAQYRQCLDRNPKYGPGYVGLAECLRRSGRVDEARRYFSLYLDKFPTGSRRAQAEAALQELGQ